MSATLRPPRRAVALQTAGAAHRRAHQFLPDHLAWFRVTEPTTGWCRIAAVTTSAAPIVLTSPGLTAATSDIVRSSTLALPARARDLLPAALAERLRRRSPLTRIATPTVWEAAATAIVRQVIHRDQARRVHKHIAEQLGTPALIAGHARHAFPVAEAVLAAGEQRLRDTGVGFKARTLMTLAEWTLDGCEDLDAAQLHDSLLGLRGVGPWTAGVATCDRFSDFSYYPFDDLAVRAAARTHWPERRWPASAKAFAREWKRVTEPFTGSLTAFMLAETILSEA